MVRATSRTVVLIAMFLTISLCQTLVGQTTRSSNVLRSQLDHLAQQSDSLLDRVGALEPSRMNSEERLALDDEILTLQTLVHRLQETAMKRAITGRQADVADRRLLLVGQACQALDFLLLGLSSYVETSDRAFLALARDGRSLRSSVERSL